MKKQSQILLASLAMEDMDNLTKEVKETIAFDLAAPKPSIFTAAQLWNIQRQIKTRAQRKFL